MNFINEMRAFNKWAETNPLPPHSQLLWFKLFFLFNDSGWTEWITVDNLQLMALIKLRREATFIEHRDNLIHYGLIEYRKGRKGCPNKYKYISFEKLNTFNLKVQTEVYTEVQPVVQTEVYTEAQTVDLNKTKQNKTKTNTPPKSPKAEERPKTVSELKGLDWDVMFAQFIEKYPRKQHQFEAEKIFVSSVQCAETFDEIMRVLDIAILSEEWTGDKGRYIPNPDTFLSKQRWKDQYTVKGGKDNAGNGENLEKSQWNTGTTKL